MVRLPDNIVFFGPPGVGKGVQASRLSERRGMVHFSMGEALRTEISEGSELGATIGCGLAHVVHVRSKRGGVVDSGFEGHSEDG